MRVIRCLFILIMILSVCVFSAEKVTTAPVDASNQRVVKRRATLRGMADDVRAHIDTLARKYRSTSHAGSITEGGPDHDGKSAAAHAGGAGAAADGASTLINLTVPLVCGRHTAKTLSLRLMFHHCY